MLRIFIITVFQLFAMFLFAQKQKEFEGIIKYNHSYIFDSEGIDTAEIINLFGRSSVFYYKEGNYKWIRESSSKKDYEYFDAKTQTVYSQYHNNDTLFLYQRNGYNDSLSLYVEDTAFYKICDIDCKMAGTITFTMGDTDMRVDRAIYYSPKIYIPPNRFSGYRTYATNKVINKTQAWPLKIVLASAQMLFTYTIEAAEIIYKKLEMKEVSLPQSKPIKDFFD